MRLLEPTCGEVVLYSPTLLYNTVCKLYTFVASFTREQGGVGSRDYSANCSHHRILRIATCIVDNVAEFIRYSP